MNQALTRTIQESHELLGFPEVHVILAADRQGNIGYKNTIPWKLKGDLKRFKQTTQNHIVIMGLNTYKSIGSALPDRDVIVLSTTWAEMLGGGRRVHGGVPGKYGDQVHVASGLEAALGFSTGMVSADQSDGRQTKIFVAGGASVYHEALKIAKFVHLTLVHKKPKFQIDFEKWLQEQAALCDNTEELVQLGSAPQYDATIQDFNLRDYTEVQEDGVILDDTNDGQNIPIISHSYHLFMRASEKLRHKATPVHTADAQFESLAPIAKPSDE